MEKNQIIEGEAVIESQKLVDKEKKLTKSYSSENLSKTMMQSRGIVAFEIEITEIQATKMSQNRR
jgi:transcriptional regulator